MWSTSLFLINGLIKGNWMEAFFFALSVAVGLTPEMLPMIVTADLGRGAIAMSDKKVIVKNIDSIQNFGAMDILFTDKTGTLTQDKIILDMHLNVYGEENDEVPIASDLGFVPLPVSYFFWLALILSSYCVLTQLVKTWFVKKYGYN